METWLYFGAGCIGLLSFKLYQMFRVPNELKDIPSIPLYSVLYSIIKREPFDVMYNKLFLPVLEKHGYARTWSQGEWVIVLVDPHQIRTVLNKTDIFPKRRPNDKSNNKMLFRKALGNSSILVSDGHDWRRHRQVANPAFKKTWPDKLFTSCTDELIEKIVEHGDQPIVVQNIFQSITLDALGRGMFSYDFEAIKKGEENRYLKLYNEVMKAMFHPLFRIVPILETLVPSRRIYHAKALEFRNFLKSIIQTRKDEILAGSDNDDLLSMMIRASNGEKEGSQLSDEDVCNDLATFFLAGHDTTANTLSSIFYYISLHQDIQETARKEVLSVLGESSEVIPPTTEQLKGMTYIEAIIKETMRCITTVPQVRRYCTTETALPGGLTIPKDTYVVPQMWGIHHDPEVYPDPTLFNPDRFIDLHTPQDNQWSPFGGGARMCIGKNFSLIEQRIVLVMLLQKFTFSLGPRSKDQKAPKLSVSGLLHPINLEIQFVPRI